MPGAPLIRPLWGGHECGPLGQGPRGLPESGQCRLQGTPCRHLQVHPRGQGQILLTVKKFVIFWIFPMQFCIHTLCGTGICSLLRRGFVNYKHI